MHIALFARATTNIHANITHHILRNSTGTCHEFWMLYEQTYEYYFIYTHSRIIAWVWMGTFEIEFYQQLLDSWIVVVVASR